MKKKNNKHTELGMRIASAVWVSGKKSHEFAAIMRIPPSNLSRWINGTVSPSYEYLVFIASISKLSIEWLLTGKGWAYIPAAAYQAIDWISKQFELKQTVRRVLIVPYYDNLSVHLSVFGRPNGFIIEKEKGNISMSGRVIRSGGADIGQNTYIDMLSVIKSKGVRADKISLADHEIETLNNINLSSLLLSQNITKNIIDNELSNLRPNLYSPKKKFTVTGRHPSTSEAGDFMYATTEGPLDSIQVGRWTGLTPDELRFRCPGGPCEPLTLEEAEQIIKKRRDQNTAKNAAKLVVDTVLSLPDGDADLSEIIQLLKKYPENKNLVLKLLKGKQEIKEAMEGLSGLSDKK